MKHPDKLKEQDAEKIQKRIFRILLILLFAGLPLLSLDAGINGDENFQIPVAQKILDFYTSFGQNRAVINEVPGSNPNYYGKLFEFWSALLGKITGHSGPRDLVFHKIRHVLSALFGFLIFLFAGLTAKELAGWRAGIITIILLFLSPRLLGHSLFNVKDIPFAAGYMMALYFMIRIFKKYPGPSGYDLAGLAGGIALAINMRVGGLLLIVYLWGFYFLYRIWVVRKKKNRSKNRKSSLTRHLPVKKLFWTTVAGYFCGLIFWPYGLLDPIENPLEALTGFTNWELGIRVLFEGEEWKSHLMPWHYIPKYILITTPILVLAGGISGIATLFTTQKRENHFPLILLLFTAFFPVVYVIYKESNLYDGWRHLLFVYAPFVVVSACGWEMLYSRWKKPVAKVITIVIFLLLMINPAWWTVRSHPYEYVYFNEFTNGLKGAYGKYENDYYMISVRRAMYWLRDHISEYSGDSTIYLASNASYPLKIYAGNLPGKWKITYSDFHKRSEKDWDYAVFISRFVSHKLLNGPHWPPANTIHTIDLDEVPLCVILKRQNRQDLRGFEDLRKDSTHHAIRHFKKYLENDPNNENVLMGLAYAYIRSGNLENAKQAAMKALDLNPDYPLALGVLGGVYKKQKQYRKALSTYKKAIEINPNFSMAYYNAGDICYRMGNPKQALNYLQKVSRKNKQAWQMAKNKINEIYKQHRAY